MIELTFDDFRLEYTQDCTKDALIVYDGGSKTDPKLITECGPFGPISLYSSTNELLLTLTTDSYGTANGFKLSWRHIGE